MTVSVRTNFWRTAISMRNASRYYGRPELSLRCKESSTVAEKPPRVPEIPTFARGDLTAYATSSSCSLIIEHVAWPHSQAISTSSDPASRQESLQYFSPWATTHVQGMCAQVFSSKSVMRLSPSVMKRGTSSTCQQTWGNSSTSKTVIGAQKNGRVGFAPAKKLKVRTETCPPHQARFGCSTTAANG
jgi:hypothetical protein